MATLFAIRVILMDLIKESINGDINIKRFERIFANSFPRWIFTQIRNGDLSEEDCHHPLDFPFDDLRKVIRIGDILRYTNVFGGTLKLPDKIMIFKDYGKKLMEIDFKRITPSPSQEKNLMYLYTNAHKHLSDYGMSMYQYYRQRLIDFYSAIDFSAGNFLSTPPSLFAPDSIFGDNIVELFASPLNTSRYKYCSAIRLETEHFGSLGSYHTFDPKLIFPVDRFSLIIANPPYSRDLVIETYSLSLTWMKEMPYLVVVYIIPTKLYEKVFTSKEEGIYRSTVLDQSLYFYEFSAEEYRRVPNITICLQSQIDLEYYGITAKSLEKRWRTITSSKTVGQQPSISAM